MLLEAVNSVFLTFLATEYILNNQDVSAFISQSSSRPFIRYTIIIVVSINIFIHFHTTGEAIANFVHDKIGNSSSSSGIYALFHIPRVFIAISTFIHTLYWDCKYRYKQNCKHQSSAAPWSNRYFIRQLIQSFIRLLPVYPFLAVVISFGFLFLISAFEKLHLNTQILNMPIYYGTLYGPLMMMYWDVKKTVARSGNILPR